MARKTLSHLTLLDIAIVTLILFGEPIYTSTQVFFSSQGQGDPSLVEVTAAQNWYMIGVQSITLLVALVYLLIRRFDFRQWKISITLKDTVIGLSMFVGLAVAMDVLFLMENPSQLNQLGNVQFHPFEGLPYLFQAFTVPSVAYAFLNGIYEEIYFIGICTAVKQQHRLPVFLFSLIIRIAFHTYQGILPALGIGLILGIFYYTWYRKKSQNLYPIFLSHAIADVIGLSLLWYFFF